MYWETINFDNVHCNSVLYHFKFLKHKKCVYSAHFTILDCSRHISLTS